MNMELFQYAGILEFMNYSVVHGIRVIVYL
jgi:hypothetical protein